MATKGGGARTTTLTVAVVGLTSSSFVDQSESGAGKSCLCNRFIWPHEDHYYTNHPYIVNYSEYGDSVINNTHFLYWGEKVTSLEDSSEVYFRVIEHTEFVEDMSLKPFHSQKAYHKRITVTKLQSSGKLQYVAPNQLTLPEEYTSVSRFPDKNQVDGFILCIDASASFSPKDIHYEVTNKLLTSIQSTKKQFVIALTKCDTAPPGAVATITETLSKFKRIPQIIEISSHESVNVELCFLYLAHLIDSHCPKSRVVPYEEAAASLRQRIKRNETTFKEMLASKLTDFTTPISIATELIRTQPEATGVAQFKGEARCRRLIELRLSELKNQFIDKQAKIFLETLPQYLERLLPDVGLTDTFDMCIELLRQRDDFSEYFVDVEDWERNNEFIFSIPTKTPFSILHNEGKVCVENYISQLQLNQRKALAQMKIKQVLEKTDDLQPGIKVMVAMEKLGLTEEAQLLSLDILQGIYLERTAVIEQKCTINIHELLLERLDLFHQYTPGTKELIDKLQDEPRMKQMEHAPVKRDGIILKHISNLEVLDHGPYFTPDLVTSLATACPSLETVREGIKGNWALDEQPDGSSFDLALFGRTSEETLTLRSDIMNSISGSDVYKTNNKSYQLNMSCFEDTDTFTSDKFLPQGVVIIITSVDSLEWAGIKCAKFFVTPSSPPSSSPPPPYRGLPCVLLVVDEESFDGKSDSDLYHQSKRLALTLQCVLVVTRPVELPGRLVSQETTSNVLSSLFDVVSLTKSFLSGPKLEEDGLNFTIFSLPGDPIDLDTITSNLTSQQLIHFDDNKRLLYMKIALEKQHRIASLSLHSTINAKDFSSHPVLGFIILYSAERKASLAAVRWLLPRLHEIPILLIAITDNSLSPLVQEGQALAKEWKKMIFAISHKQLDIKHISDFCSSCFFVRFTTWNSQRLPEDVLTRLCKRKNRQLPRAQPDLPFSSSMTLPHSLSRHSIAVGLDDIRPIDRINLMKSPSRRHYRPISPEEEDDPMYTSPADIKRNTPLSPPHTTPQLRPHLPAHIRQDHRRSLTPKMSRSVPHVDQFSSLPRHAHNHVGGYVVVPDSEALNKLDTLGRRGKVGGGKSDPNLIGNDSPEEEEDEEVLTGESLYSDPRDVGSHTPTCTSPFMRHAYPPPNQPPPLVPNRVKLYDHLTPRTKRKMLMQQNGGVDIADVQTLSSLHQESIYSLAGDDESGRGSPVTTPSIMYDDPNKPTQDIYSLATEPEIHDVSSTGSPRQRRTPPPPELESYSYVGVRGSATPPPDAIYAEPILPRNWSPSPSPPPPPLPSSTTPPQLRPPIPPKPGATKVLNTSKLSPSLDRSATVREKSPRQPETPPIYRQSTSPNIIRHVIPDDQNPDNIYALPIKPTNRTAYHTHTTFHDATPPCGDLDDEDGDGTPPPIPERNYNWSDIEDDDEDVFHSDDESAVSVSVINDPIGLYATVDDAKLMMSSSSSTTSSPSMLSPPPVVYRCSTEVEELEAIYMNYNQIRTQLKTTVTNPEESIYDTLEKVQEAAAAASNTNTLPSTKMNTTPTMPPLSKNALKLMKKMEKKSQKESERRKKQESKRRKKEEEDAKRNKKGKKLKHKSQRKRYFESSLGSVVEQDGVPRLVKLCACYIEEKGLETEGVYRVSGKREDIMIFQEKFDQDPSINIECGMDLCVNAVSGVMKNFFKLLPDPLIPESLLSGLLDIPGQNPQSQKKLMHEILSKLPKENIATLRALVKHLNIVQTHHGINKMNASNLSIVFWPTLMRPPLMDLANPEKQLGFQLTMAKLIENPDFIPFSENT